MKNRPSYSCLRAEFRGTGSHPLFQSRPPPPTSCLWECDSLGTSQDWGHTGRVLWLARVTHRDIFEPHPGCSRGRNVLLPKAERCPLRGATPSGPFEPRFPDSGGGFHSGPRERCGCGRGVPTSGGVHREPLAGPSASLCSIFRGRPDCFPLCPSPGCRSRPGSPVRPALGVFCLLRGGRPGGGGPRPRSRLPFLSLIPCLFRGRWAGS